MPTIAITRTCRNTQLVFLNALKVIIAVLLVYCAAMNSRQARQASFMKPEPLMAEQRLGRHASCVGMAGTEHAVWVWIWQDPTFASAHYAKGALHFIAEWAHTELKLMINVSIITVWICKINSLLLGSKQILDCSACFPLLRSFLETLLSAVLSTRAYSTGGFCFHIQCCPCSVRASTGAVWFPNIGHLKGQLDIMRNYSVIIIIWHKLVFKWWLSKSGLSTYFLVHNWIINIFMANLKRCKT